MRHLCWREAAPWLAGRILGWAVIIAVVATITKGIVTGGLP